jgi:hypothetical protein
MGLKSTQHTTGRSPRLTSGYAQAASLTPGPSHARKWADLTAIERVAITVGVPATAIPRSRSMHG